jgi:fucokinase
MTDLHQMFLAQSYRDAYGFYRQSLEGERALPGWDYVILTASNEAQAASYRRQIDYRLARGMLPKATRYQVLPDPDGARIGSGGATMAALHYIRSLEGPDPLWDRRALIIHSGGDSRRAPQYSACGKLFSPVPRMLPTGRRSTLFDEFIIGMSAVPGRMKDGVLVASGDVLLLFNPLQIDFHFAGAAALSTREGLAHGVQHGVFLPNADGDVARFLHKLPEASLREAGAVDDRDRVALDTGAVLMDGELCRDLLSLIETDGEVDPKKLAACLSPKARLSFYADFLYPLAADSTLEKYQLEKPEGDFTPELRAMREALWPLLHRYRLKLMHLSPAQFIHFGTTRELLRFMTEEVEDYQALGWLRQVGANREGGEFAASGSSLHPSARVDAGSYVEDSLLGANTVVGRNAVVSSATLLGDIVPDHTALHVVKLMDGRFCARLYGVSDNPKEAAFLGRPIARLLEKMNLAPEQIWDGAERTLWTAKLFPVRDTALEAARAALKLIAEPHLTAELRPASDLKLASALPEGERISLKQGFERADGQAILDWQDALDERVRVEKLLTLIEARRPASEAANIFFGREPTQKQIDRLLKKAEAIPPAGGMPSGAIRARYYLSKLCPSRRANLEGEAFRLIRDAIYHEGVSRLRFDEEVRILKDRSIARLPLRVNFGGGWSDTPPYCNENGGTVLNAAIRVGGRLPVEAKIERIPEKMLVFASGDSGAYGEFTDIAKALDCSNPFDPFALHKATLVASGILPSSATRPLSEILTRLGGGFKLSTQVKGIPRGSGLGTSSILAGACVQAISDFFGIEATLHDQIGRVLCAEQLMSTGGGWQDQAGGMIPGVKLLTSAPGAWQEVSARQLAVPEETMAALEERFCLIYTGQRRLARGLLREVMGRYIAGEPEAVSILRDIQVLAKDMARTLESGNLNEFAQLLSQHWELSKHLDAGGTNTCIDCIFVAADDLLDGKMICGAGGGGYLQGIMKPDVTLEELNHRLSDAFPGTGVAAWKCDFNT